MRYFVDTEFLEDGKTIDMISIAVVSDDGREFYAVSSEFDVDRVLAHPWLRENVWPHLPTTEVGKATGGTRPALDTSSPLVMPRRVIADRLHDFLLADGRGPDRSARQLCAYFAAYDHVTLAQLYGPMINLPAGIPMFTCDIKQEIIRMGNPDLPGQDGPEHHALADARWNRDVMHELDVLAAQAAIELSTPQLRREVSDLVHDRLLGELPRNVVTRLAADLIVKLDQAALRGHIVTAEAPRA